VAQLKYLFQPLRIGRMEVRNRIVMPGMDVSFGINEEGCVTPQLTEYFVERARGRPGMIVAGAFPVHHLGSPDVLIEMVPLWKDKVWPSLERMVRSVHNYDAKFGAELVHVGLLRTHQAMCPSVIPELAKVGHVTREMSKDEIKECVKAFGAAAQRCIRVGFDFVEILAGHGYLINEFLTPYYNRRTDEYGGSFDNRIRFLLEVIHAVRNEVGNDIPVGIRLNGDDYIKEGAWTLTDLCRLAPILEKESISYLSVSGGGFSYGTIQFTVAPMYEDQGIFVRHSEEVKKTCLHPRGNGWKDQESNYG
jgi:2,4-dienoyl-CoA reductase-like NADH-dependent reductase (Old Yellow Enzyme family)